MGMLSIRFDEATESAIRRAARTAGLSVSDYVRASVERTLAAGPRPTTLERLGDAVGRFDSSLTPRPAEPDELGDFLEEQHRRQADESRALRRQRDAG